MPTYDYRCATDGLINGLRRGYDDATIDCPLCEGTATRVPVNSIRFTMEGQSMPRRDDIESTQEEYAKEVRKRGWSADRAIDGLRANKFEDETGQLRIDTRKMPQTA